LEAHAASQQIENAAYNRAADLAKSYAEHWQRQVANDRHRDGRSRDWSAKIKAGHWRIIEKEIRDLARHDA
jgi:hypothetical protein